MAETRQSSQNVPVILVCIDVRNGGFSTILQVRPGTHRFHFLVDGEWKISNEFAAAVDSEGNLLNYLEAAEYDDSKDMEYMRNNSISCITYLHSMLTSRARARSTKGRLDTEDTQLPIPYP